MIKLIQLISELGINPIHILDIPLKNILNGKDLQKFLYKNFIKHSELIDYKGDNFLEDLKKYIYFEPTTLDEEDTLRDWIEQFRESLGYV